MYTIMTDSCCDLNPKVAAKYEKLEILPLSYTIGGETYPDNMTNPADVHAYYDRLRAGESSTTSQISPSDFYDAFEPHVKNGEKLLCIHFSSALSGHASARPAA